MLHCSLFLALPTFDIVTLNNIEHNNCSRVKYRIVVIGNLDPHSWTKNALFTLVMFQVEFHMLTAIAIQLRCPLCLGNLTQTFFSILPPTTGIIRLLPAPLIPHHTSQHLSQAHFYPLRALYFPRQWYVKILHIFVNMGLKPLSNSHCIFTRILVPGQPPIYIGLYFDGSIYFSPSIVMEGAFHTHLISKQNMLVNFTNTPETTIQLSIHIDFHLSQEASIDALIDSLDLHPTPNTTSYALPFKLSIRSHSQRLSYSSCHPSLGSV